jgi:RNA polymerase sigma-70 factor (ECF subfamily)
MRTTALDLSSANDELIKSVVARAAAGDAGARRELVVAIAPVVHTRVARALLRRVSAAKGRDPRQELEDLVQEVFAALLSHELRALQAWDATRGLSFERFVGFLAEREVAMIMRTGKRSPWTEDPTMDETMIRLGGHTESHEAQVASRELLRQLSTRLREQLSPKGRHYFQLIFVESRSVEAVAEATGASTDAVYAWRSRLGRLLRELRAGMTEAGGVG